MAKTVTIGDSSVRHLVVSDKHLSPLCGATRDKSPKAKRTAGIGDVTCSKCKQVFAKAVENALASK